MPRSKSPAKGVKHAFDALGRGRLPKADQDVIQRFLRIGLAGVTRSEQRRVTKELGDVIHDWLVSQDPEMFSLVGRVQSLPFHFPAISAGLDILYPEERPFDAIRVVGWIRMIYLMRHEPTPHWSELSRRHRFSRLVLLACLHDLRSMTLDEGLWVYRIIAEAASDAPTFMNREAAEKYLSGLGEGARAAAFVEGRAEHYKKRKKVAAENETNMRRMATDYFRVHPAASNDQNLDHLQRYWPKYSRKTIERYTRGSRPKRKPSAKE